MTNWTLEFENLKQEYIEYICNSDCHSSENTRSRIIKPTGNSMEDAPRKIFELLHSTLLSKTETRSSTLWNNGLDDFYM